MARNKSNGYQKQFIRLCFKYLPNRLLLALAARLHIAYVVRRLNGSAKTDIIGRTELKKFTHQELLNYLRTANAAVLWHGTGRYQHQDGKTVDVLESILGHGSLNPVEDAYAIFGGGQLMNSISLTKYRILARCYADMHGKGFREPYRYGNAIMWTSYYYSLFYARLYALHYPTVRKYYKTWHSLTHDASGHNTWGKKVNLGAEDVWDAFGLGSDIENNYPIVIGLKRLDNMVKLPKYFGDYEVRIARGVKVHDFTHFEVPLDKVDEVARMVKKWHVSIPVLPIELGEVAASRQDFSVLIGVTLPALDGAALAHEEDLHPTA